MKAIGIWKTLSTDTISGTLKFGFLQTTWKYPVADASNSIVDQLYSRAEKWLREVASNYRNPPITGRYAIYLFRIPATEFTMVPVLHPSDIEQNCLIEIVLVPVETNQHTHSLYRCQLNIPTNCSRCAGFIAGVYKQGFRCQKCRMTFHKDCAPFFADDCPVSTSVDQSSTRRPPPTGPAQLTFLNPFVADLTTSMDRSIKPCPIIPMYPSSGANAGVIAPHKIIEKGIFPACIRGSDFRGRFLFRLTTNHLSITSNTSQKNVAQSHISQSDDAETMFPLTDIVNLVLTHLSHDRDDIFEIHLQDKTVLSVGKKGDSEELQMQTAQFYSILRDQREALINAEPLPPISSSASNASPVPGPTAPSKTGTEKGQKLRSTKSIYQITSLPKENERTDLHELYTVTGEKIGEGAFGRVVAAFRKGTRHEVAVKIIEKLNCGEEDMKRINEEAKNLYKFNHMNILKLEAYYEREEAVYLVTERMETDMCKYITEKEAHCLDEDLSRMIAYQLIVAVRYLHSNNCGHLDIKCENILISLLKPGAGNHASLSNREYPLVKLADFGYSRIIGEHSFRKTRVGTKVYSAPEIHPGTAGYNRLADMWSIGIVLYAALSGTLPYDEAGAQRAEEIVRDRSNLFGNAQWTNVSKLAQDLIANKLLVVKSTSRITSNEALFDDWFCDFDLYSNLHEIQRRAKQSLQARGEKLPTSSNWLTREREDEVWMAYESIYEQS